MAFEPVYGRPAVGRIVVPEARVSYPAGGKCESKYQGILTTSLLKYRGVAEGKLPELNSAEAYEAWKGEIDPRMWEMVPVQCAVSHNQRTTSGSRVQAHRMFALGSSNGEFRFVGLATALSPLVTHESLNTTATNNVASESTKASLTRAAGTAATTQATALDGLFTATVTYTWTATGTESVSAVGAGLFDTTSTASFNLYAEATFTAANVQPADQLQLTWTITN